MLSVSQASVADDTSFGSTFCATSVWVLLYAYVGCGVKLAARVQMTWLQVV